jgi:hypothetical protein
MSSNNKTWDFYNKNDSNNKTWGSYNRLSSLQQDVGFLQQDLQDFHKKTWSPNRMSSNNKTWDSYNRNGSKKQYGGGSNNKNGFQNIIWLNQKRTPTTEQELEPIIMTIMMLFQFNVDCQIVVNHC